MANFHTGTCPCHGCISCVHPVLRNTSHCRVITRSQTETHDVYQVPTLRHTLHVEIRLHVPITNCRYCLWLQPTFCLSKRHWQQKACVSILVSVSLRLMICRTLRIKCVEVHAHYIIPYPYFRSVCIAGYCARALLGPSNTSDSRHSQNRIGLLSNFYVTTICLHGLRVS